MLYGNLFRWDPFEGWWFLNFGRNLVFPLESYYHAVFFGVILALLRERYMAATILLAVLCTSHPYSGSELLAIVTVWSAAEAFIFSRDRRERKFFFACVAIGFLHVAYYLIFLPQFPEHRGLVHQWSKHWFLDLRSASLAYGPVALFAVWAMMRAKTMPERKERLLLFWAVVAFLLAKHELFTSQPVEPLHFTRGYVWTPLFLLGLPVLLGIFRKAMVRRTVHLSVVALAVVTLFLLDNALWFTAVGRGYLIEHVMVAPEQRAVFDALNRDELQGSVVLTLDRGIATLSPVYTSLRPWTTQLLYTDEDARRRQEVKDLFLDGRPSNGWRGERLAVVLERGDADPADSLGNRALKAIGGRQREVMVGEKYRVVLVEGAGI
jgi:hypothetical protein